MDVHSYLTATIKPWNIEAYAKYAQDIPGLWGLVTSPEQLLTSVSKLKPRYLFFPHWSWTVSEEVLDSTECIGFHLSDLPYGRGGSPLQNLILRGVKETQLTAFRMQKEVDAGPIYLKRPISLSGSAEQIYRKTAVMVGEMITEIISQELQAEEPQEGEVIEFTRRTPEQSELPTSATMEAAYDHIRMLDAPTYPKAFVHYGDFRFELSAAYLDRSTNKITATVEMSPVDEE